HLVWVVAMGGQVHKLAVIAVDGTHLRAAEAHRVQHDRVEHRPQVCRRAGDDGEDLAHSCLVFERFLKLALARLLCVEQPGVLYGDHGLRGEVLQQSDLAFGESPYTSTTNRDPPNRSAVAQQRNGHEASIGNLLGDSQCAVGGVRLYVRDLYGRAAQDRAAIGGVIASWPREWGLQSNEAPKGPAIRP